MTRRDFLASAAASPVLLAIRQSPPEREFLPLFDGVSLNGWTVADGPESAFYVSDAAIVVHESAGFPTWLRSARQYENFDFRGEFFVKGWMNSGIYLHAPEHGSNISCGMKINIFQQVDRVPKPESMGSIFPVVPPLKVNVRNNGEWNSFRILMDWPRLQVWTNDELVQDVNVDTVPELRDRLRSGYLGLESLSYPIRFRALRVRELPSKVSWTTLYEDARDLEKWRVLDGKVTFQALGPVLHGDGDGHFGTNETYGDFELQMYLRHVRHHNGGVVFGAPTQAGGAQPGTTTRRYEIQLHDVEGAHYPTGSLYGVKRSIYPRIEPEQWWLFQLRVKGTFCQVRCNGDTVLEHDGLVAPNIGPIGLQAHDPGRWTEYKHIRVRRI